MIGTFNHGVAFADDDDDEIFQVALDKEGQQLITLEKYEGKVGNAYESEEIKKYIIKVEELETLYLKSKIKGILKIVGFKNGKKTSSSFYANSFTNVKSMCESFTEVYPFVSDAFPEIDNANNNHGTFTIENIRKKVFALVLVEFKNEIAPPVIDKTKLKESIKRAEEINKNKDNYYIQDDRYRGKKYPYRKYSSWENKEGKELSKWNKFQQALKIAKRLESQCFPQKDVNKCEADLNKAISELIPKTEINATDMYDELYTYENIFWEYNKDNAKINFQVNIMGDIPGIINDDNTVENQAYLSYKEGLQEAKAVVESLYVSENIPSESNKIENESLIRERFNKAMTKVKESINGLKAKIYDRRHLINLVRAYRWIQFYANELFDGQTDKEYLEAREEAVQFLENHNLPNESMALDQKKPYFDMYEKIRSAYQGIGKRSNKKISVNVSYVDARQWQGKNLKGYIKVEDSNNCLEKKNVELDVGKTTVFDLFQKLGKVTEINGKPTIKMGPNHLGGAMYINGVYQPGINLATQYTLGTAGLMNIELNDKDEVLIVGANLPVVQYFEGYYPYQSLSMTSTIQHVKYQEITLLNDNIKMGESIKLKVEAKNGDLYNRINGEKMQPVSDSEIYISQAYETEEEARNGKLTRFTGVKTDEKGEGELKLYTEGWYILNSFKDDIKFWDCNGSSVVFHVQKSDDIEKIRKELEEKLNNTYEKLGREHYSEDKWNEVEGIYKEAVEKLKAAKTGKDMADAVYPAVEKIEKLQKEASDINENNLTYFYYNLNRFPDNLENMDAAANDVIKDLKSCYDRMTEYQRGQLDPVSKEKYDSIVEKYEKGLPEAKEYNLSTKLNLDSVEEGDRQALTNLIDELKKTKPTDDVLTLETGGIPLAELFSFNSQRNYKNGVAFDSFNKHTAMFRVFACVNPDYIAYLNVRNKDPEAKFNVLEIGGGKISDEDTSMDLGTDKDIVNVRLLGKMSYIVNDHAYEIKDIKVSGVEKYQWEKIPFYEQSCYKGKTKEQCNMYIANSFASFEMPFEDVEVEIIFGSKYGDKDQIESAKISAKDSIESAFQKYKKENYEEANWQELLNYRDEALKAIDSAKDMKEVNNARSIGLSNMAKVKEKASAVLPPATGEPDSGSIMGKVYTSVENTTFPGGAWTGRFLEGWYDFGENDTMMTIILKALKRAGFSWNGTGGNGNGNGGDDYTITYLAYIYKDINNNGRWDKSSEPKLGEFDGEGGSGWMGTLNDWFTNFGFQSFSYKNGWLTNNDVISVQFTQNLGVDLGGTWGNSDTRLKDLKFSKGKLVPEFSSDVHTYDLILPSGSEKESILITPTAMNKNYLIKAFLNLYNDDASYYKRPETMGVKAGDTIYIGCGDRSWPSMNKQGAEARYYVGTKYTIRVQTAGPESIAKRIAELPEVRRITMNSYREYEDRVNALYQQYQELSKEDKAKIKNEDAKKLKEVYEQIKFFSQIGKVKEALNKIPEIKKGNESAIKNAKPDIEAASKLYKALSDKQKKYITVSDAKKFNDAVEWLKAHGDNSIAPIEGTPDRPEVETTKDGKKNVTVTKTEITVVENVATVTVKDVNAVEMLKQAKEYKSSDIIIDADEHEIKADKIVVELSKKVLENVLKDTESELVIKLPGTEVRTDRMALKEIVSQAKGSIITLETEKAKNPTEAQKKLAGPSAEVFTLNVKSNDIKISNFGGGRVTVRKLIPSNLEDKKTAVVYFKEDGTLEVVSGKRVVIDNMKFYEFQTNHFSDFAIVDADEAGIEVEDTMSEAEAEAIVKSFKIKAKTKALKKSVKITVKVDKEAIKNLKDNGYIVKYRYYRSNKDKGYKKIATKAVKSYIDKTVKKGKTYYYKVALRVYDANGKLIAKTTLKDCKYGKSSVKKANDKKKVA